MTSYYERERAAEAAREFALEREMERDEISRERAAGYTEPTDPGPPPPSSGPVYRASTASDDLYGDPYGDEDMGARDALDRYDRAMD
jgi:hypothetical protein